MTTLDPAVVAAPAAPRSLASWLAHVWRTAKRLYLVLMPLRFSFLALLAIAFAFVISAQGYDIIAHIAEDDPTGTSEPHTLQRFGYIFTILLFALQIWYWSRQLLHIEAQNGRPQPSEFPRVTAWVPRLLGALTFVVAIASLARVWRNYDVQQPVRELKMMAVILAAAGLLFLAFVYLRRRIRREAEPASELYPSFLAMPRITKILLATSFALSVAFFLWATFAVQSTEAFGSAAIVILGLGLAIPVGSAIVYLGMRYGVPVLTFLLIWAVVISPLADNHVVETFEGSAPLVAARPTVTQAFDRWYARLDRDHPGRQTHPVFIVATEGGGIRAAYWTAAVLTSLGDTIPEFNDHLFAISSVSGGSLGATVYDALLVKRQDEGYTIDEQALDVEISDAELAGIRTGAKHILSHDALAPTLAAMLQPDLAQRFIPAPILPDRARALEGGWEHAWERAIETGGRSDEMFAGGFLKMMNGREDRTPSLFLNGTVVETGRRMIASNCRIEPNEIADSVDLLGAVGEDIRVSTAAHNSARFTYVSPAGTLVRGPGANGGSQVSCEPGESCEHVVDGGYFENSGAATASDLLDVIRRHPDAERIRPHVIFISFRMQEPKPIKTAAVAAEALSPIRALLSTRGARGTLAVAELKQSAGSGNHTTFELVQHKTVFPLGWLLADRTRNLIDAQMGPDAGENGKKMAAIAALLRRPLQNDPVQDRAIEGEAKPKV